MGGLFDSGGHRFAGAWCGVAVIHRIVELLHANAGRVRAFALGKGGLGGLERGVADAQGNRGVGLGGGGGFRGWIDHSELARHFIVRVPFERLVEPGAGFVAPPLACRLFGQRHGVLAQRFAQGFPLVLERRRIR